MLSDKAVQEINDWAGSDGWWKRSSGETCVTVVSKLVDHGVPENIALDLICDVVDAMRSEYGE